LTIYFTPATRAIQVECELLISPHPLNPPLLKGEGEERKRGASAPLFLYPLPFINPQGKGDRGMGFLKKSLK
jgi:hypothetical protein